MRIQGRIESWNDQRGFGFVVQNSIGTKAFVHISALADRRRRPVVGALVTYEVAKDDRGRPKAVNVRYVESKVHRERSRPLARPYVLLAIIAVIAFITFAFVRTASRSEFVAESSRPQSNFSCEPRKSRCTEMTSCAEARFHQNHCGVTTMDGDNDGIPCEDQWCH